MSHGNFTQVVAERPAALFDYDGTLIRGDSTLLLLGFTVKRYPAALGTLLALAGAFPGFAAGLVSRAKFKEVALQALRHVPVAHRDEFFREFHDQCLEPRLFPEALRRLEWHRHSGHLLVIVSASVDLYLHEAARRLQADHLVCTRAVLDPSPRLVGGNCRGEEKVRRVMAEPFATTIRWGESWAYGDSLADRPLLERCGHPVGVRPRRGLRRVCLKAGWPILRW
jgi:HAD superfamily hydrolase (TIGR01490 family)